MAHRSLLSLTLALALAGCQGTPVGTTKPKPVPSTPAGSLIATGGANVISQGGGNVISQGGGNVTSNPKQPLIGQDAAGIIGQDAAGIVSRDGAGLIHQDGAGISGVAAVPAGLINQDGAGLIGHDGASLIGHDGASLIGHDGASLIGHDGASYRVAALADDQPVRQQLVYLMDGAGKLVLGDDQQPITAKTDDQGRFSFPGIANGKNMLLAVKLYDDKGYLKAIVPHTQGSHTVDLGLASSLTTAYIQAKFLAGQTDPVATLDRLGADLEVAARTAVGNAAAAPPADLTTQTALGVVDALRAKDPGVNGTLQTVHDVLVGLSNQGAGEPANRLETDALDIAVSPTNQLVYASPFTSRVWRKDAQGHLVVVAGSGLHPTSAPDAGAPAPGDGGPATQAAMQPAAIAYMPDGTLLIADQATRRIRQVAADGTISTRVASADWEELRDLVVEPDGGLVVATHAGLWRVPPGGKPTLIAGEVRAYDIANPFAGASSGDGGPAAAARFRSIYSIARDPANGDLYLHDTSYGVRMIHDGTIKRVAGTDTLGFSGDGGPATQAQLSAICAVGFRADGKLVISDLNNHRLRLLDNGTITTMVGNGTASFGPEDQPLAQASIAVPASLALAPDGTLYFVDDGYVRCIAEGKVSTVIGGTRDFNVPRPPDQVQLLDPHGLVYDAPHQTMYIEDQHHVWQWDLAANQLVSIFGGGLQGKPFAPGQPALQSDLGALTGFTLLDGGAWSVLGGDLTTALGRVVRNDNGSLTSLAGGGTDALSFDAGGPVNDVTIAAGDTPMVYIDGWYYLGYSTNGHIFRFQPGGKLERWGGFGADNNSGTTAMEKRFYNISELAVGPDHQLYIGTPYYIYKADPATGAVTYLAGSVQAAPGDGKPATQTLLKPVGGFAWDPAGNLYFVEPAAGAVFRLRQDNQIIERIAGAGTANLAGNTIDTGLSEPSALAFGPNGDLYIADSASGQIKILPKAKLGN